MSALETTLNWLSLARALLKVNGSSNVYFYTDERRTFFYTEIAIHPEFLPEESEHNDIAKAPVEAPVEALEIQELSETELQILRLCQTVAVSRKEILDSLGHKTMSGNVKKALQHLKAYYLIEYTIKDRPNSRMQKYTITVTGRLLLSSLSNK